VRVLNKQKIKLVGGGHIRSFAERVSAEHVRKPGRENVNGEAVPCGNAELAALMGKFLLPVVKATGADAGAVRILSASRKELLMIGSVGLPAEVAQGESLIDAGCGVCGKALGMNGIQASSDLGVCMQRCGTGYFGAACRHVLALPLEQSGNAAEHIGVLSLFFAAAKELSADEMKAMRVYAELLSAAWESAKMNAESRRIALLAERQSIANEIHDSLAQTLYYAKMRSSLLLEAMRTKNELLAFKCARDIDESLAGGQKAVRELVTHFRCQMDTEGLQHALQKLVKDFFERTDIPLEYVNRVAEMELPLEHELQVFLIVREALVNIGTHSGATAAHLTVDRSAGRYVFVVADNGGGGCSNAPVEGHYGLMIMRERAARIDGEVQVESFAGLGTRVRLSFSIPAA
jgi:two-component system nitrate/nitrite sensor histidine kinase NarX